MVRSGAARIVHCGMAVAVGLNTFPYASIMRHSTLFLPCFDDLPHSFACQASISARLLLPLVMVSSFSEEPLSLQRCPSCDLSGRWARTMTKLLNAERQLTRSARSKRRGSVARSCLSIHFHVSKGREPCLDTILQYGLQYEGVVSVAVAKKSSSPS